MNLTDTFFNLLKYTKRYSIHTVENYRIDLLQFEKYLTENSEVQLDNVTHYHIRNWIISLMEEGISPRSVNRKITTLKSFYKFLLQQQVIVENPVQKIESLKTEKKLPVFIKNEQIDFLFNEVSFGNDFENVRNKIILELLYNTGIRLAELINLKNTDINFYTGSIKVNGKRNKERIIPLSKEFVAEINSYITIKNKSQNIRETDNYLFITTKGDKLYPKLVYRIVNKYLGLVSTQKKKSPHVLRHTFATHMLNNGADLNAIKEILGHANLAATEVYTHISFEKLKSIYKQAHPRALIMEE